MILNRAKSASETERKQAEEALCRAHHDLEERVRQRTADLAKANKALRPEIAERKQAEDALRESEGKYRLVVENANEAITVAQDGMLRFVNPKAAASPSASMPSGA